MLFYGDYIIYVWVIECMCQQCGHLKIAEFTNQQGSVWRLLGIQCILPKFTSFYSNIKWFSFELFLDTLTFWAVCSSVLVTNTASEPACLQAKQSHDWKWWSHDLMAWGKVLSCGTNNSSAIASATHGQAWHHISWTVNQRLGANVISRKYQTS